MKFIGKSKFAQYFTAAYLLKDSLSMFYIEKNKEKLNENYLYDMTFAKQQLIHNIIKKLPEVKCTNEERLEIDIFKYVNEVKRVLDSNPEIYKVFNIVEDTGGFAGSIPSPSNTNTVAGIAQGPGQYMGVSRLKAIDPMKVVKKDLQKQHKLVSKSTSGTKVPKSRTLSNVKRKKP